MGMATDYYGPTDAAASRATLERALERGVTLFDTADAYGEGANESFVAPFIRAHREEVVIATKFGIVRAPGKDFANSVRIDNRPEHIRLAVDASLRRLGIETIDLYYMHRRNPEVPLADSVGAMAELVARGKVRWLGLSEVDAGELREAHAIHPITAVESEWSLFSREIEDGVVPAAAELGVAVVPFSPLGRGQLTGQFGAADLGAADVRRLYERFGDAANDRLVAKVREIAARRGATPAQVALAWLHGRAQLHGLAVVPIPGTRKPQRLDENVDGALLALSAADLAELEPLGAAVQGRRTMAGTALKL
jgi:aryl-alcohol dehydrogenase-like predicted oxidoreductase